MVDLPTPESDDRREQDAGELFRPSPRHLPITPAKSIDRKFFYGLLAAAAAVTLALLALGR